jgi:eukaryotic-like serine/threonine-protein kinase
MLLLLDGSLVVIIPNTTKQAFLQPHIMETNSSSSSDHLGSNTTSSKFLVYDNNTLGIKISYPSGWTPSLQNESSSFMFLEFLQNMTGSPLHQHTPLASFVSLSITNTSDTKIQTMDSLTKQNLNLANHSLPNFQLIESNKSTFGNNPAYRIVYTFVDPSTISPSTSQFKSMNIWTIKGHNVYTLSYSQPTSEYDRYIPIIQQMVDSFEVTK